MKKKICIIVTVILSILLCACLFYNFIAGAPTDHDSAIRYIISAAGLSIILSGFSGYSIFKIFLFKAPEDEETKETKNVVNKLSQNSFSKLVSAFNEKGLTENDIDSLRSFLDSISDSDLEEK